MPLAYFTTVTFGNGPAPKTTVYGKLVSLLPYFRYRPVVSCVFQENKLMVKQSNVQIKLTVNISLFLFAINLLSPYALIVFKSFWFKVPFGTNVSFVAQSLNFHQGFFEVLC